MLKTNHQVQESVTGIDENGIDNPTFQTEGNYNCEKQNALKTTADELKKKEKRRIWKSLACLYITVTLCFSSSLTLVNSITSLFPRDNFGVSVLSIITGSQVVSAVFIVSVSLKMWGCLKMLRIGLFIGTLFVIAFFYPTWTTLIIGGIAAGFNFAILYAAGFMYANSAGYWLAHITNANNLDAILVRVSGIMNASLDSAFIWGNIALYFILDFSHNTDINSFEELCGAAYCNQELNLTTLQPPSPKSYYTLIGILTAMGVIACATSYFLEDFSVCLGHEYCSRREMCAVYRNSLSVFKNSKGFLLAPLTVAIAMEESFLLGDVTKAFISCSLGISMIGLIIMAFGVTATVVSFAHWPIVQKLGRPLAVGTAVLIFLLLIVTLLFWKPNPHQLPVYFVLVCLWGMADSILISVTFATYGAFFEDNLEGAFTAASFWISLGQFWGFVWSPFICVNIKLYFIATLFGISFVLYLIVEKCVVGRKK